MRTKYIILILLLGVLYDSALGIYKYYPGHASDLLESMGIEDQVDNSLDWVHYFIFYFYIVLSLLVGISVSMLRESTKFMLGIFIVGFLISISDVFQYTLLNDRSLYSYYWLGYKIAVDAGLYVQILWSYVAYPIITILGIVLCMVYLRKRRDHPSGAIGTRE